jgi:hypothetical protein
MADLLTTAQTAEKFNRSVPTINRWAAEGRLPVALKLDGPRGANLFDPKVVQAILDAETAAAQQISA